LKARWAVPQATQRRVEVAFLSFDLRSPQVILNRKEKQEEINNRVSPMRNSGGMRFLALLKYNIKD
jgi:Mg-chelatase subunit ChlD